jgi:hypothetical protein
MALQRERQLKRWSRAKKLALIQNQTTALMHLSQSRRVSQRKLAVLEKKLNRPRSLRSFV